MTGFPNHVIFIVDIGWLFIEQYASLMFIDYAINFLMTFEM